MDDFPQARLGDKDKFVLHEAALADRKVLEAALDIRIEQQECSAEECGSPQQQGGDSGEKAAPEQR